MLGARPDKRLDSWRGPPWPHARLPESTNGLIGLRGRVDLPQPRLALDELSVRLLQRPSSQTLFLPM